MSEVVELRPATMANAPTNLVRVTRRPAPQMSVSLFPNLTLGGTPKFDPDEHMVWQGALHAEALRQMGDGRPLTAVWEFAEPAFVWVTDRRVVYTCRRFAASRWTTAWAGVDDAVANTCNAMRAEARRVGRIAAGHVRHDWPINVILARRQPRIGHAKAVVGITCIDPWDGALVRLLLFDADQRKMTAVASSIVTTIASYRLQADASGAASQEDRSLLTQQALAPITLDGRHPFDSGTSDAHPFAHLNPAEHLNFVLPAAATIG